jgi:hypothetical protein
LKIHCCKWAFRPFFSSFIKHAKSEKTMKFHGWGHEIMQEKFNGSKTDG